MRKKRRVNIYDMVWFSFKVSLHIIPPSQKKTPTASAYFITLNKTIPILSVICPPQGIHINQWFINRSVNFQLPLPTDSLLHGDNIVTQIQPHSVTKRRTFPHSTNADGVKIVSLLSHPLLVYQQFGVDSCVFLFLYRLNWNPSKAWLWFVLQTDRANEHRRKHLKKWCLLVLLTTVKCFTYVPILFWQKLFGESPKR